MLEMGEIITLNGNKEYIIVNKIELHNVKYVFLISNFKPLEIVVGTEKNKNGNIIIEEVKDNDELDYVLSKFVLTKDQNQEFDE